MLVETITIAGKNQISLDQTGLSIAQGGSQESNKAAEGQGEPDLAQTRELVADVKNYLSLIHNVNLQFSVHKASGNIVVTVTEEETGKVIREIPPREILNLAEKFEEMIGLIFDEKG